MHVAQRLSAADWKQIELLRDASPERRATLARSLSRMTLRLARRAIRETHPDASEDELAVRYVEAFYGRDLAARFKAYLAE